MWQVRGRRARAGAAPVVPAADEDAVWTYACSMLKEGYDDVEIRHGRDVIETTEVRRRCIELGRLPKPRSSAAPNLSGPMPSKVELKFAEERARVVALIDRLR